jgi:hypothetical protein
MRRARVFATGLLFLVALTLAQIRDASAVLINIDTSVLATGTSATLDFALIDGDFDLGNSTVTISDLATDGTPGSTVCTDGCAGTDPYVIDESFGLGQLSWNLVLGTYVQFNLAFTSNFSGTGVPDLLVLNLLDPDTSLTLIDTDLDALEAPIPYQDALLLFALTGDGERTDPTVITPVGEPPVSVAEPSALGLVVLAIGLLIGGRRRFMTTTNNELQS